MKIGRVADTQIECSVFVLLSLLLLVLVGVWQNIVCYFFVLVLHESAHMLTAKSLGCQVAAITLLPFGFSARLNGRIELWDQLCIAAAGPLCSLLIGVICLAMESFRLSTPFLRAFAIANFTIGFMNLLPVYPLDGGRVLRAVLYRCSDASERLYAILGLCFSLIFLGCGFFLYLRRNPSFLIMSVFLLASSITELFQRSAGAADMLFHSASLRSGSSLKVRDLAVDGGTSIREAYAMSSGRYYTIWNIVDARMNVIGRVDEGALLYAIAHMKPQTPISSLVDPAKITC